MSRTSPNRSVRSSRCAPARWHGTRVLGDVALGIDSIGALRYPIGAAQLLVDVLGEVASTSPAVTRRDVPVSLRLTPPHRSMGVEISGLPSPYEMVNDLCACAMSETRGHDREQTPRPTEIGVSGGP